MLLRQFIQGQRPNRKSLNKNHRLMLWKQAHGRCWYCGCDVPKTFFVLEHVEPFSRGGADSKRNLVVSCWPCDRDKGKMNLAEFRLHRNVEKFYGEDIRPMDGNLFRSASHEAKRAASRARRVRQREHWRQLGKAPLVNLRTNPAWIRTLDNLIQNAPDWETTREWMRVRYAYVNEERYANRQGEQT